ncbi:hypothetical protein [Mesorhizobium sp. B4-1-1]|uniref:hypothetical protein n=1 Tax=Mesorhizobium sp. B4-1-1 TaxID=2589890 RepID=UPI0015E2DF13|nr:hypothetical protein [Mesorhizobium sp. B4-1-1]
MESVVVNDDRNPGGAPRTPFPAEPAGDFTRALIQVLSPDDTERAIEHACRSLRPGDVIYITGSGIIEYDRLSPAAGVYLNLTSMNLYPGGTAYTISEHFAWLTKAGLRRYRAYRLA